MTWSSKGARLAACRRITGAPHVQRVHSSSGAFLLLPGACTLVTSAPTDDDADVAFAEVVRMRLDSFSPESPVTFVFRVPAMTQWKRLREAWGDHGYIAYAERHEGSTPWILPFSKLNLEVTVSQAGRRVAVKRSSECPYLVSSETDDCAVAFKPSPGDELEVTLVSRSTEETPPGDFVIKPYWSGHEKDRIVGAMIDSDLQPSIVGMAVVGVVLLITSSILAISSDRRAGQI